jgi:Delta7-sterol 5-desaturase
MTDSINPLIIFQSLALHAFMFDFGRYIIAATLIGAVVWLMARTRFASRKIQQRRATHADMRREFLQSVRSCFVYIGITVVIVWAINMGFINRVGPSLGWPTDLALFAAIIVAHDAYFYWVHRAMHHPRLYKRFHLAHHRSVTPTPLAIYSFSVEEALVMAAFVLIWQLVVPTPGWVFFSFMIFQVLRNAMGHAGSELMPRWWLSTRITSWVNTTTHHDLHHNGSFKHNYGLYFTWWDKWMGTEHPRYHARFAEVVAVSARAEATDPAAATATAQA